MSTETITTLASGTYRLTREVINPRPDRRASQDRISSWEAWTRWPEGMLFVVDIDTEFPTLNRIHPPRGIRKMSLHDAAAFSVLVSALEPVKETPSDYILRVGGSGLVNPQ